MTCGHWGGAEGDEKVTLKADYLLIPIRRAADNNLFSSQLQPEPPFVRRLCDNHATGGGEDVEDDDRLKRLQAHHLLLVILREITSGRIKDGCASLTVDDCRSLAKYLAEELQVSAPLWEPLVRVARFRSCFATDDQFRVFLREMRARALARFPEFQREYPTVAPFREPE
jgi:hypothetical protein